MNFAIVGCGRIAPRHAQSLQQIPDARLTAVVDVKEQRAKKFALDYHAEPIFDFSTLLERKDVDVVNICTPSGYHAQMAIAAMEAGKHVIVEKPMALSLSDADRMIAVSNRTKKKLCVVLQNRYNPPMLALKKLLNEDKLGNLFLGNATVRWYRPQEYYDDEWHGTIAMDGGALMNQSIHHIDALQWCMGKVESVFAKTATLAHKMEAEDAGVAILKFQNGALSVIEGSTVTYPQNLEGSIAIFGATGSVKVGGVALNQTVFCKVGGLLEHEREMITQESLAVTSVYGQGHKFVIEDMFDAIIKDRSPRTSGYEARNSVAIVLAIYQSAASGQTVEMSKGDWYLKSESI